MGPRDFAGHLRVVQWSPAFCLFNCRLFKIIVISHILKLSLSVSRWRIRLILAESPGSQGRKAGTELLLWATANI